MSYQIEVKSCYDLLPVSRSDFQYILRFDLAISSMLQQQQTILPSSGNNFNNNITKTFIFNNTHSTSFACKKCTNLIRAEMYNISYTKTQQNFYKYKPYLAFIMKPCLNKVVQRFEIILYLCENHAATNDSNNCLEDELLFQEAKTNQ